VLALYFGLAKFLLLKPGARHTSMGFYMGLDGMHFPCISRKGAFEGSLCLKLRQSFLYVRLSERPLLPTAPHLINQADSSLLALIRGY